MIEKSKKILIIASLSKPHYFTSSFSCEKKGRKILKITILINLNMRKGGQATKATKATKAPETLNNTTNCCVMYV
jgi:hypothetical protein